MNILLLIVVFLLALDVAGLTHILHRPLIACTLFGAVLGNFETGIMIGGSLELYYITYESQTHVDGLSNAFFFASLIASILASVASLDATAAVESALACIVIGLVIAYAISLLNTLFLPIARNANEKGNQKKLSLSLFVPYILNAIVYVVLAFITYQYGQTFIDGLSNLSSYWWIMATLSYASALMPCLAFAILLRNIGVKDVIGALLAGVGFGTFLCMVTYTGFSYVLVSIFAFALACFSYHTNQKQTTTETKQVMKKENTIKKGAEKWW